ncbi:MAG: dTMP kinase [Clostridia bacterium]|nr:dTMP kinase [Clostridia bacterium]
MARYQQVIFDLDGTLTDSAPGIIASIKYALKETGRPIPDEALLRRFIGPPLAESFIKWCGMSVEDAIAATIPFKKRYNTIGWQENRVFPGIRPLLQALKAEGCYLAVATGKPQDIACQVLEHFDLLKYFDAVAGPNDEELHADKGALVRRVLRQSQSAAMVGDTPSDVLGGHANGISGIAVRYGYGVPTELAAVSPDAVADTVAELQRVLLDREVVGRGVFLSIEGLDGCGKTTQRGVMQEIMTDFGFEVRLTREPGGCELSEKIRELLLNKNNTQMTDTTEALLYAASRAQHVREVIRPELALGHAVLSDRFVDSSLAYQGGGRELGVETVWQYNEAAVGDCMPDITVYLDIDFETSLRRRFSASDPDRMERQGADFFRRSELAFAALTKRYPERFLVVDGRRSREEIADELRARLPERLKGKGLI